MIVKRVDLRKKINRIRSYAPCRVDFAGGSLDLWPIGIILDDCKTINCAINLFARVDLKKIGGGFLRIVSEDYGISYEFKEGMGEGKLPLIEKICRHYGILEGWEISIRSDFPIGSGLGGSSAISVALAKALLKIKDMEENPSKTVLTLRDLEAKNLKVPTGVQDFWPALLGGVLAIHYRAGEDDIESLGDVFPFLEDRMVVVYTGKSHFSAETNYELYRSFLDGDKSIQNALKNIASATKELYYAFKEKDFERASSAMIKEWQNRKKLSPKISTKKMEELEKVALSNGAMGVKCCGAGGGGSMVFLVKPGMKRKVELALKEKGATILSAKPSKEGCIVEVE